MHAPSPVRTNALRGSTAGLILCALLAGCLSNRGRVSAKAVENYIGDFRREKIVGPFGKGDEKRLAVLTEWDRERANELLEQGGIFFLTFRPNEMSPGAPITIGDDGRMLRVLFVSGGEVIAEYRVRR